MSGIERSGSRVRTGLHIREPIFKRPLDLCLAIIGLAVSSPLWMAAVLAILLEDGVPVFFRQYRIGRHGRLFRVLKFRSMVKTHGRVEVQAQRGDPRVTRVGRILRRYSFDEMPQLWNVLKGEMSFVGPRAQPEREIITIGGREREIVMRTLPGFELRQHMRPGLTGLAQLFAPREVPHRQKFRYDLIYARRLLRHTDLRAQAATARGGTVRIAGIARVVGDSCDILRLDLWLIMRSVWVAARGKWEV